MTMANEIPPAETDGTDSNVEAGTASRRSLLSKGAIAAAVGVAAGVALNDKANAANGDDFRIGNVGLPGPVTNSAGNTTRLQGGSTLEVYNGSSVGNASIYGRADDTGGLYGVHGNHTGTQGVAGVYGSTNIFESAGVFGQQSGGSTQGGPGVKGVSENGTGVYGENTNSSSGGFGVYGKVGATTGGNGVRGEATGTQAVGVYGLATGTNSDGVYGRTTALDGNSVYGQHISASPTEIGTGVRGVSDNGIGVVGSGTTVDLLADGIGQLRLNKPATPAITATSPGTVGSLARNSDGGLWYCYATGMWRQLDLAPTVNPPSVLAFNPVTPFRVYDSRRAVTGGLGAGSSTTVSVKDARDVTTYAVTTPDAVPTGARAVSANVVAIGTVGTGFAAINPGGVNTIGAAALNWVNGQNIGNAGIFSLNNNRELQVIIGPGTSLNLSIDITGYYI